MIWTVSKEKLYNGKDSKTNLHLNWWTLHLPSRIKSQISLGNSNLKKKRKKILDQWSASDPERWARTVFFSRLPSLLFKMTDKTLSKKSLNYLQQFVAMSFFRIHFYFAFRLANISSFVLRSWLFTAIRKLKLLLKLWKPNKFCK
jgi:hypothetical protein